MQRKYWIALVSLMAVPAILVACGGAAETEDTDGTGGNSSSSTEDLCAQFCAKYAECNEGGSDEGSSESDFSDCRDSCLGAVESAHQRDCDQQTRAVLACSVETFSCSNLSGSGDEQLCAQESDRFASCVNRAVGSGS